MSDKSATEQLKELVEKVSTQACTGTVGRNGMTLIENPHIPDHLILMSDAQNLYVTNMLTGEVTKIPRWDWSLAYPVKYGDAELASIQAVLWKERDRL